MIELVFVIVVLGILASLAMGRMDRDLRQEAADSILSHIRLTQQLALRDNKHRSDNNVQWQKALWRIQFIKCSTGAIYNIASDKNLSASITKNEAAIDPINGKYLYATCSSNFQASDTSKNILIGKKFGIKKVTVGGCSIAQGSSGANQIAFDYLGRPYRGITSVDVSLFQKKVKTDCKVKVYMKTDINKDGVVNNSDKFEIIVESETGHAYIKE